MILSVRRTGKRRDNIAMGNRGQFGYRFQPPGKARPPDSIQEVNRPSSTRICRPMRTRFRNFSQM